MEYKKTKDYNCVTEYDNGVRLATGRHGAE